MDLTMINTIRTQTLDLLNDISESPRPSYSIDGHSVSWTEYRKQLLQTVDWCNRQLNNATPVEIHSHGVS